MSFAKFEIDGVPVYFEVEQAMVQGGVNPRSGTTGGTLVERASQTLIDAALQARKVSELFAQQMAMASADVSVAISLKLSGDVGFVFVNSKAEASITVTTTFKFPPPNPVVSKAS